MRAIPGTEQLVDAKNFKLKNYNKIDANFMNKNAEFFRRFLKPKRGKPKNITIEKRIIKDSYNIKSPLRR